MLPLVEGLSQTARDAEPLHQRLAGFLAQRRGASTEDVAQALERLESAFGKEADEQVKGRIAAAIAVLRGDKKDEDK